MIWPLKAGFPCQSEGIFKQCTEEVVVLTQVAWFFYNLNEIRISDVLELVRCDRVEWAKAVGFRHQSEVHQFLAELLILV